MISIAAKCKTVTPMISSGANQQQFEIRATEVKSALRFWWRAFQPSTGKSLFEREAELFGSTSRAAPFRMSVEYDEHAVQKWEPGFAHNWGDGL